VRVPRFTVANLFRRAGAIVSRRIPLLLAILLLGLTPALAGLAEQEKANPPGQAPANPTDDNQGLFLLARSALGDAFFAKSIVLMLPVETEPDRLVVGLIINKPAQVKLHELFPHAHSLDKQDVTAYFGGPVDIHDRSAIFRSPTAPKGALHIFANVYVTFDSDSIDALVKNSQQPSELRIFLGRSQWSHPQLQHEILAGAWYSFHDNSDPIFSSDPGKLWQTLLDRVAPRPYIDYRRRIFNPAVKPRIVSAKNDLPERPF
jgi:putative transcriptional regulator